MSEGSISQEEIDALLSGVDTGGLSADGSSKAAPQVGIDIPTLTKFAGDLKDKLSANLNTMTGVEVQTDAPTVEESGRDQLLAKIPETVVAVMDDFSAGLTGDHLFLLSPEFAQKLVGLINKEENAALDDMALSVISEVVSNHSGAEITVLSAGGKLPGLATNPPEAVNQPKAMVRMPQDKFAVFTYPVTIDGTTYTMWEAVSSLVADGMAKALGGGITPPQAAPMQQAAPTMAAPAMSMPQGMPMQAMMQPQMMGVSMNGMQQMSTPPNVQALQFPNLQPVSGSAEQGNIGLIMDVYMEMTVELGRTKKTIKDILGMGEGTIIELDKLAGEPVDILVNHKPIAKGEVVVIDENFGVRVTEILPAIEHVTSQM
ncbi:MAG: flagellar motor switch protein FliN [Treponema sp.]|jgi:flagellar motor switch protein FliN/FliY|nr:flagellar motor switch protein FliN [Treponema sp.]